MIYGEAIICTINTQPITPLPFSFDEFRSIGCLHCHLQNEYKICNRPPQTLKTTHKGWSNHLWTKSTKQNIVTLHHWWLRVLGTTSSKLLLKNKYNSRHYKQKEVIQFHRSWTKGTYEWKKQKRAQNYFHYVKKG